MSDEIPDRSNIIRSTIITVVLSVIFLVVGLAFWAWSQPDVEGPVTAINEINPFITLVIEILLMFCFFVFITVTVVNLRLFFSKVRAGWTEIIIMLIMIALLSYYLFGSWVAGGSVSLSLGFVVYLYWMQE